MNKEFEYKGLFFLPNNELNIEVHGILKSSQSKGITLDLFGTLNNSNGFHEVESIMNIDVIFGRLFDYGMVSLFLCRGSINIPFTSRPALSSYKVRYLLLGKLVNSLQDKQFNYAEVNFTNLFSWRTIRTIKWKLHSNDDQTYDESRFTLNKSSSIKKEYHVENDFSIEIMSSSGFESTNAFESYILHEYTTIKFKCNLGLESIQFFEKKIKLFEQFLSLANMTRIETQQIYLVNKKEYSVRNKFGGIPKSNELIYSIPPSVKKESIIPLFNFADIEDEFNEIIKNWYDNHNSIEPIREHLIASISSQTISKSTDFLIIVQSLEGYHRRFINSNKLSLEKRLTSLSTIFKEVKALDLTSNDFKLAKESRDYYSHFYEKTDNVLDGYSLTVLTNKLRKLLICCVLNSIGMSVRLIDKLVQQNRLE